jgi:hypothetical protein
MVQGKGTISQDAGIDEKKDVKQALSQGKIVILHAK